MFVFSQLLSDQTCLVYKSKGDFFSNSQYCRLSHQDQNQAVFCLHLTSLPAIKIPAHPAIAALGLQCNYSKSLFLSLKLADGSQRHNTESRCIVKSSFYSPSHSWYHTVETNKHLLYLLSLVFPSLAKGCGPSLGRLVRLYSNHYLCGLLVNLLLLLLE